MKWIVHGERMIYESEWVSLALTDIEIPGGPRFDHHVVRMPAEASGTVIDVADRGVLLLWRHRFTTDTWGWEVPAGRVDDGETPIEAAAREAFEETGWRPGELEPIGRYFPYNGTSDGVFNLFRTTSATYVGDPTDPSESERIEWVSWPSILDEIAAGRIGDGLSLTALLWAHMNRTRHGSA
ncbi:MAG: hydrolase [Ilumatobacteraceae bacterium]|nr:hydrolase [Ilumatobacteraceae bacterium]